jgi:dipeptidyl aminopeptidase/acylaminoacyl peptidase
MLTALLSLFLLGPTAHASTEPTREFLELPATHNKVEYVWAKPEGAGPWPLLVLIHPHQEWPDNIGAEAFVNSGLLKAWPKKGWITVALSQPGYGKSEGHPDFCGPVSQQAALAVIDHFRKMDIVKKNSIVVYGGSRGAVIAAMIATQDPNIAGFILKAGLYDFVTTYERLPWYNAIKLSMIWEIGLNRTDELRKRSALYFAEKIRAPLLILHAQGDDRAPIEFANLLADKVRKSGTSVEFHSFDSGHIISSDKIRGPMEAFLNRIRSRNP